MLPSRSTRSTRLPIGTMGILLALIIWGLQYKLSLYYNSFQTASEPPAKLLSGTERLSSTASVIHIPNSIHSGEPADRNYIVALEREFSSVFLQPTAGPIDGAPTHIRLRAPPRC